MAMPSCLCLTPAEDSASRSDEFVTTPWTVLGKGRSSGSSSALSFVDNEEVSECRCRVSSFADSKRLLFVKAAVFPRRPSGSQSKAIGNSREEKEGEKDAPRELLDEEEGGTASLVLVSDLFSVWISSVSKKNLVSEVRVGKVNAPSIPSLGAFFLRGLRFRRSFCAETKPESPLRRRRPSAVRSGLCDVLLSP